MSEINLIYITVPKFDDATRISRTLLEECLVACANILPGMTSIYRWNDKIVQEQEVLLLLKTPSYLSDQVVARVKSLHSYECPAILVMPIEGGFDPYIQWVKQCTPRQKIPGV